MTVYELIQALVKFKPYENVTVEIPTEKGYEYSTCDKLTVSSYSGGVLIEYEGEEDE